MIVLYDADPSRVYLIGVGLGGNAVYQLAARLPDRFAALSVNSGHTLGLNLKNLINIPIQIQVGENDIMFEKKRVWWYDIGCMDCGHFQRNVVK